MKNDGSEKGEEDADKRPAAGADVDDDEKPFEPAPTLGPTPMPLPLPMAPAYSGILANCRE